jgi:hypothetical protein
MILDTAANGESIWRAIGSVIANMGLQTLCVRPEVVPRHDAIPSEEPDQNPSVFGSCGLGVL